MWFTPQVKKAAFEQERIDWESANNVTIEDLKRMSLESIDGKKKSKVKEANSYINGEKETQILFQSALSGVSFRMGSSK